MKKDSNEIVNAKKNAIVAHMTQGKFIAEIESFLIKICEDYIPYVPHVSDDIITKEWDAMLNRIYPLKHLSTPDIFWYYDKTKKILFIIPKNDITVALFYIIKRNTIFCDSMKDKVVLYGCELESGDQENGVATLFFKDNTGDNHLMITQSEKNGYYSYDTKKD